MTVIKGRFSSLGKLSWTNIQWIIKFKRAWHTFMDETMTPGSLYRRERKLRSLAAAGRNERLSLSASRSLIKVF